MSKVPRGDRAPRNRTRPKDKKSCEEVYDRQHLCDDPKYLRNDEASLRPGRGLAFAPVGQPAVRSDLQRRGTRPLRCCIDRLRSRP